MFPFLYEKIITYWRNGKTCNELRTTYGCGPEGSQSDFRRRRNPSAVRSGIRAQHESESELPPGANDYETTALSASPIVRDICLSFSIGLLCEPNLSDTHAKRTFALRRQSR